MLAHRPDAHASNDDQLIGRDSFERRIYTARIVGKEFLPPSCPSARCFSQFCRRRIVADRLEQLPAEVFQFFNAVGGTFPGECDFMVANRIRGSIEEAPKRLLP